MGPVPDDPGKTHNELAEVELPELMMVVGSSESEGDEDDDHGGYQLLPQEPDSHLNNIPNGTSSSVPEETGAESHCVVQETVLDNTIKQTLSQMEGVGSNIGCSSNSMFDVAAGECDETKERTQMWNVKPEKQDNMDQDHANKIKDAMSGFSLPTTNQPDWAKVVPEEEWKARLFANLRHEDDPEYISSNNKDSNTDSEDKT